MALVKSVTCKDRCGRVMDIERLEPGSLPRLPTFAWLGLHDFTMGFHGCRLSCILGCLVSAVMVNVVVEFKPKRVRST